MTAAQAWLTQEVNDLLDVGSVGLYELLELLRSGEYQSIGKDEAQTVSRAVAAGLVAQGRATICLLRWPKDDVIDGPLTVDVLSESGVWEQLPSKLYFALIPASANS